MPMAERKPCSGCGRDRRMTSISVWASGPTLAASERMRSRVQSPVEQQETVSSRRRPVPTIETRNAVYGCQAQFLIALGGFARGIGPVRQQCELEIANLAGKIVNLQPSDQLIERLARS